MIDFPANPTVGQQFTAAGVTWVWDGVKWSASGLSIAYVPLAGFVPAMNDNRLINGDMRVDQRGVASGGGGTATGYTVDRWTFTGTQANKGQWQRTSAGPQTIGFPYGLIFSSSSAYVSLATDAFQFAQPIEADMISDFQWGTAQAQPVTLSFWAYSSLTGTFSGAIGNYAGTRAYPFTFSIPIANVWTKVTITIPGDTVGTWAMSGNAGALIVRFDLGSGANYRGPAGAWGSINASGANGAVSVVATNGAQFMVTGVKLEIGNVATPYNRQSLAKSLADCQRYYYQGVPPLRGSVSAGNASTAIGRLGARHPVQMRASPTITMLAAIPIYDGITAATLTSITTAYPTIDVVELDGTATVAMGGTNGARPVAVYQGAGGNLTVSAEL
jgi:hypothetical protein